MPDGKGSWLAAHGLDTRVYVPNAVRRTRAHHSSAMRDGPIFVQKPKAEDIEENAPEVHAPKTTASGVKTAPVAIERELSPAGLARTVRQCCGSTGAMGSTALGARGRTRSRGGGSRGNSARTVRRRSGRSPLSTVRTVPPAFPAEHSIAGLGDRSEFWLGSRRTGSAPHGWACTCDRRRKGAGRSNLHPHRGGNHARSLNRRSGVRRGIPDLLNLDNAHPETIWRRRPLPLAPTISEQRPAPRQASKASAGSSTAPEPSPAEPATADDNF
jgi:hypothetical protein